MGGIEQLYDTPLKNLNAGDRPVTIDELLDCYIYAAPEPDELVKLLVGIIVFFSLIDIGIGIYRQLLTGRTVRLPV